MFLFKVKRPSRFRIPKTHCLSSNDAKFVGKLRQNRMFDDRRLVFY